MNINVFVNYHGFWLPKSKHVIFVCTNTGKQSLNRGDSIKSLRELLVTKSEKTKDCEQLSIRNGILIVVTRCLSAYRASEALFTISY